MDNQGAIFDINCPRVSDILPAGGEIKTKDPGPKDSAFLHAPSLCFRIRGEAYGSNTFPRYRGPPLDCGQEHGPLRSVLL